MQLFCLFLIFLMGGLGLVLAWVGKLALSLWSLWLHEQEFPIANLVSPLTLKSVSELERTVSRLTSDWISFATERFLQKSLLLTDFSVESANKVSKEATDGLFTMLEVIGWPLIFRLSKFQSVIFAILLKILAAWRSVWVHQLTWCHQSYQLTSAICQVKFQLY